MDRERMTFRILPLTLGLETKGGIATPLVLRGTPLPAQRASVFSTGGEDQTTVEVNVVMGESLIAKNNLKVATLTLTGIPKAPKGQPQIRVTVEVDRGCGLTVSAIEQQSGQKAQVESKDAQVHLSDDKIKHLLQQAEKTRAEDEKLLKSIETRAKVETLVGRAESYLRQRNDVNVEKALAELGMALDSADDEKLQLNIERLEKYLQAVSTFDLFGGGGFGGGDIFSSFFGTGKTASTRTTAQKGSGERAQPSAGLSATGSFRSRMGRIFGGGEFTADPNLCFVLMPLSEELRPIYEDHIRPVAVSEGLSCVRADELVGPSIITQDIWERTNRARVIIAELTGKNPNVFYEVGLAHALSKEVILITQTMGDVPFDLKAVRCIVYSFTPRGVQELENKLHATIKEVMRSS